MLSASAIVMNSVTFLEVRALAAILDTNVAGLEFAIEALDHANYVAISSARRKK